MKQRTVLGIFLCLFVSLGPLIRPAEAVSDRFKKRFVMDKVEASGDLGFVHYHSDVFRSNEMGWHMGLGLGVKPKLKILEFIARFDYMFLRTEESRPLYERFNDSFVGITTLELAFGRPVDMSDRVGIEILASMGVGLFTIQDYKTRPAFSGAFISRFFLRPNAEKRFKLGLFFEGRTYMWSLDKTDADWAVEWVSSKKVHVMRDMNGLLGLILTFGGALYKPPCTPSSPSPTTEKPSPTETPVKKTVEAPSSEPVPPKSPPAAASESTEASPENELAPSMPSSPSESTAEQGHRPPTHQTRRCRHFQQLDTFQKKLRNKKRTSTERGENGRSLTMSCKRMHLPGDIHLVTNRCFQGRLLLLHSPLER